MEKSYITFVTDLRKLLLAAMDLKEEEIYFSNDGEKYGCLGDRLFVESGHMEKAKTVCGLHTEELYKRYCQEHSFENIVHDCVREIKKVSENCVLCDLDDLKDYEKVKSRLFIRLLNADKNRTILHILSVHQESIIGKKCCLIRHMKEIISWISLEHTIQIKGLPGIA